MARAGSPAGLEDDTPPSPPYFDMAERIITDLRAIGIRGKVQSLEGPAFRSKIGQGRKGFPGNRTIVQTIDPRAGGSKANIAVYAVCDSPSSFICDPQIEALWKKHQSNLDLADRERLVKQIPRIGLDEYYFIPVYLNPVAPAVRPRGLPGGG